MKIKYFDPKNSIVNFSNSLLKHFNVSQFNESIPAIDDILKGHKRVFVILFDGMGTALIENHLPKGALLKRNRIHTMTSTFPPTTVAATNGFLSGKFPIENGWLGWSQYFPEFDANVDLFSGRHNITKEPLMNGADIRKMLDYDDIMTLIKRQNPEMHVTSVWPSIKPNGAETIDVFFQMLDKEARVIGPKFVYGYWIQPDLDTHDYGVSHKAITKIIRDINKRVEQLSKSHANTLFLIIADHGLVDIEFIGEDDNKKLFNILEHPFSNEPRAANFFVKDKKERAFKRLFNKEYGHHFILKSKEEILNEQWYGPGIPHPMIERLVGDFLAIATDRYSFDHTKDGQLVHNEMKAHHAGLTIDEMLIDIVALNK